MARPRKDQRIEVAGISGGRDVTRGFVFNNLLTPQDWTLVEKGDYSVKLYDQVVKRDDQVKSCMQQRISAVTKAPVEVIPGGDSEADLRCAWALRQQLMGRSLVADQQAEKPEPVTRNAAWDATTEQWLWGKFYGFSVGEVLWQDQEFRWGNQTLETIGFSIKVRNRRRFRFAEDGLRLITFTSPLGEVLPERKFWLESSGGDHGDDPYGLGLASWLFWPVFIKRTAMRLWLLDLEAGSRGRYVGKYPVGAGQEQKDILLEAVEAVRDGLSVTFPEGMAIELLQQASRAGDDPWLALPEFCNAAVSKVILSQTMTTDDGASLSQSSTHMAVRQEITEADADWTDDSFNAQPASWWLDFNPAFYGAEAPLVRRVTESAEDLKARSDRDNVLSGMGWSLTEDQFREVYGPGYVFVGKAPPSPPARGGGSEGVASLGDGEGGSEGAASPAEGGGGSEDAAAPAEGGGAQFAEGGQPVTLGDRAPDTIDYFGERLGREMAQPGGAWLDQIREELAQADSLVAFRERLTTLFSELPSDAMRAKLGDALLAVSLAGADEALEPLED